MTFALRIFLCLLIAITSASAQDGVSVEIRKKGYGPKLLAGQTAAVTYHLVVNDEVVDHKSPASPYVFEVGSDSVIPGFSQGVEGMQLEEIREIIVPPELGYGAQDKGVIPPNSTLRFTVTLLEIRGVENPKPLERKDQDEEEDLSIDFKDERFLNRRHATNIAKPAMFEFIIRDFFTKPWRYEDGHFHVLRQCTGVFFALLFFLGLYSLGRKRGYWNL